MAERRPKARIKTRAKYRKLERQEALVDIPHRSAIFNALGDSIRADGEYGTWKISVNLFIQSLEAKGLMIVEK